MSKSSKELLKLASQFQNQACQINTLKKVAETSFAETLSNYENVSDALTDFIESLMASAHRAHKDGVSDSAFELMQKQIELISNALNPIIPEISKLDEAILSMPYSD